MSTEQPVWKFIANLGDASPVDYGGYFIFKDETGVYTEEAELLESPDGDDSPIGWEIYRFVLDKCTYGTIDPVSLEFVPQTQVVPGGILSDNKFHPEHAAWWAGAPDRWNPEGRLKSLAESCGYSEQDLIEMFCSDDPIERARAYREVGEYYGFDNLDSYPLRFHLREDVEARYAQPKYQENTP